MVGFFFARFFLVGSFGGCGFAVGGGGLRILVVAAGFYCHRWKGGYLGWVECCLDFLLLGGQVS